MILKTHLKFFLSRFVIAFLAILFTCLALEFSIRIIKGKLTDTNHVLLSKLHLMGTNYPVVYNQFLGWVPKPNSFTGNELWLNKKVSILENKLRSNGNKNFRAKRPLILAVGDSFTFGDEVSDDETWPAILERLSHATVLNGGVFAYGLDQIVLRAETLSETYSPDVLIISFIPEDIDRCEFSVRNGAVKPYFVIDKGALILKNDVTPIVKQPPIQLDLFRKVFGYSYLTHSIMIRINPTYWLLGSESRNVRVHHQGLEVARLLLERLSIFAARRKLKTFLFIQDSRYTNSENASKIASLLATAKIDHLEVINLLPTLQKIKKEDPKKFRRLFVKSHMSRKGNEWAAREINAAVIARQRVKA